MAAWARLNRWAQARQHAKETISEIRRTRDIYSNRTGQSSRVCRPEVEYAFGKQYGAELRMSSMQTSVLRSRPNFATRDRSSRPLPHRSTTLYFGTSIPAERRRVFCALTVPEYMESWLAIPGAPSGRVIVATQNHSFSICCLDGESARFTIRCSYKACKQNKLFFDWKHDSMHTERHCHVRIRLMGEFERTSLELIHMGLAPSMLEWHRELWETSLARLFTLF